MISSSNFSPLYFEIYLLNFLFFDFSLQEIPQEQALASSFSVKAKGDPVQKVAIPKGKELKDTIFELQGGKSVATPLSQSHVEGSGSSRDPLATPSGQVTSFSNHRVHGSGPDGSSPRGYARFA